MAKEIENDRYRLVGKHLDSLLNQTGITIIGLASAIEMSVNHLRIIRSGKASPSLRTIGKIADFFNIDVSNLFLSKTIKLNNFMSVSNIKRFYDDNVDNPNFFTNRRKEQKSVMYFLRTILIKTDYLKVEREVKDIVKYCQEKYNRNFSSKAISAALITLEKESILISRNKFNNPSVRYYMLK